ncbi:hypothetical protein ARMGADRAFT_1032778 [Armillaria gallica]|uniref:Uncharacterized protein n=1 Tax=Armillaria gallica TaxID=47427 RepID=A0A2H3D8Y1_ARMGA|nr:hypothetical protein ARMGADRAFT_1032778 [Armillaria gallica]
MSLERCAMSVATAQYIVVSMGLSSTGTLFLLCTRMIGYQTLTPRCVSVSLPRYFQPTVCPRAFNVHALRFQIVRPIVRYLQQTPWRVSAPHDAPNSVTTINCIGECSLARTPGHFLQNSLPAKLTVTSWRLAFPYYGSGEGAVCKATTDAQARQPSETFHTRRITYKQVRRASQHDGNRDLLSLNGERMRPSFNGQTSRRQCQFSNGGGGAPLWYIIQWFSIPGLTDLRILIPVQRMRASYTRSNTPATVLNGNGDARLRFITQPFSGSFNQDPDSQSSKIMTDFLWKR